MPNRLAFVCLLLLAIGVPASAQMQQPIILWVAGDLYAADPAAPTHLPRRLTQDGTISDPALAINSAYPAGVIAYRALAQVARDALDRVQTEGVIAPFDLPTDLYLHDLATDEVRQIAGQPASATLFVENTANLASLRSAPRWSPDGERLVWTEMLFDSVTPVAMIYDPASGAAAPLTVLHTVPIYNGVAPEIRVGSDQYAVRSAESAAGLQRFHFYDSAGIPQAVVEVPLTESEALVEWDWVGSAIYLLLSDGRWLSVRPEMLIPGGIAQPALTPAQYSATAQSASIRLTFGFDGELGMFWETFDTLNPDAASAAFPGTPERVALSPDGRQIAFIGYPTVGSAAVWQAGTITPIAGTGLNGLIVGSILWGDPIWLAG